MLDYDELLDIVDINDQVIDQQYKSVVYKKDILGFRVVNAFIINDDHCLWIPVRSETKTLFPLCLDASVGGHVKAGETYDQAFERELYEETGLTADEVSYKCIAKLNPFNHYVSAYMQVYIVVSLRPPVFNKDDFVEAAWLSLSDIKDKIRKGAKSKGDFPSLINLIQTVI